MNEEFLGAQERLLSRYSVVAESRFVEIPVIAGRAHVLVSGAGPPVIMIPGFGDPAVIWAPLMGALNGFTMYAVDRPSFGLTDPAPHATLTFKSMAIEFLRQLLDGLRLKRPLFVGNSIGSLWAFWLSIEQPDRVAAMTHIGAPAFLLGTSAPLPMRLLSVRPLGRIIMALSPPSAAQVEKFAKLIGEDLTGLTELRDVLVAMQKLPGVRPALLELLHAVVRLRGARPEIALTEEQLRRVTRPVQMIWGENDAFATPVDGERAVKVMPQAELHVVPGGHLPWAGRPRMIADIVAPFLRSQLSSIS